MLSKVLSEFKIKERLRVEEEKRLKQLEETKKNEDLIKEKFQKIEIKLFTFYEDLVLKLEEFLKSKIKTEVEEEINNTEVEFCIPSLSHDAKHSKKFLEFLNFISKKVGFEINYKDDPVLSDSELGELAERFFSLLKTEHKINYRIVCIRGECGLDTYKGVKLILSGW